MCKSLCLCSEYLYSPKPPEPVYKFPDRKRRAPIEIMRSSCQSVKGVTPLLRAFVRVASAVGESVPKCQLLQTKSPDKWLLHCWIKMKELDMLQKPGLATTSTNALQKEQSVYIQISACIPSDCTIRPTPHIWTCWHLFYVTLSMLESMSACMLQHMLHQCPSCMCCTHSKRGNACVEAERKMMMTIQTKVGR